MVAEITRAACELLAGLLVRTFGLGHHSSPLMRRPASMATLSRRRHLPPSLITGPSCYNYIEGKLLFSGRIQPSGKSNAVFLSAALCHLSGYHRRRKSTTCLQTRRNGTNSVWFIEAVQQKKKNCLRRWRHPTCST